MLRLKDKFVNEVTDTDMFAAKVLVVAVQLPSGAVETITNYHDIPLKAKYYMDAYDENFRLKTNPSIRIIGYMIAVV